ncbi:Zinc finger BED domain-containing protein 1 [Trachymyrmex cornetzi]|uniref:Zinc finger BED domain-containing protein 1 n=1 Tax=Trachymyrmex cornetzi TaxID=471704 RepID=A0A151J3A2_9HYME|nr:Zinc finger BED domain-containing protein 1 [Trachymyrmex cornetzi]
MIAKDHQPLSIVDNEGFRALMKLVVPLYKIPSRKTITTRLDDKYHIMQYKIKAILSNIKNLSLTSDIWTDPYNTKGFLGITIHYIDCKNFTLESIDLGMQELENRHEAVYISQVFKNICEEWNIQNTSVCAIITDNAANMKKAVYDTFGSNKHVPCFARSLNLMIQDAISSTQELKPIIQKVKRIVTFFKCSVNATHALKKLQRQEGKTEDKILKLKQECKTRWNSTFLMISRFLQLANHVSAVLINNSILGSADSPEMISRAELKAIEDACELLSPIELVTVEISREKYVTCSKIIPIVNCSMVTIDRLIPKTEVSASLKQNILNQIKQRFYSEKSNIEKNSFLAISTLLDPRYKKMHFHSITAVSYAQTKVNKLMKEMFESENENSYSESNIESNIKKHNVWNIHDELVTSRSENLDEFGENGGLSAEFRQYLISPVADRRKCPLKTWQRLRALHPHLYEIALKYLVIVGTSVPCERLFSKAGNIITEKRNRLKGKQASKIIFLSSLNKEYW